MKNSVRQIQFLIIYEVPDNKYLIKRFIYFTYSVTLYHVSYF